MIMWTEITHAMTTKREYRKKGRQSKFIEPTSIDSKTNVLTVKEYMQDS